MAAVGVAPRLIEAYYPAGEFETATPTRRLGAWALDLLLAPLTLGIGYLVWWLIVLGRGQTPGKQLVAIYVMREDGSRAGGWYTFLREYVIKGLVFVWLGILSLGIGYVVAGLWCLRGRDRQCLWDKMIGTHVAYSPRGLRPLTATEFRVHSQQPPALRFPPQTLGTVVVPDDVDSPVARQALFCDVHATYLGGHPDLWSPDSMSGSLSAHLRVFSDGVEYRKRKKHLWMPAEEIHGVRYQTERKGLFSTDSLVVVAVKYDGRIVDVILKAEGFRTRRNAGIVYSAIQRIIPAAL